MPSQELCEVFRNLLRFARLLKPDAGVIRVFPEAVGIGTLRIEANLGFKGFQNIKALVDGDRRELDDWVAFGPLTSRSMKMSF